MRFGYTLMTEQSDPRDLVRHAVAAEEVGFDFEVCSDHYSPWLRSQGHAPAAWPVLGAVAQATHTVDLWSFVTCPILRYHPAVVAQSAATVHLMAEGRFTLGLGSGENLNEHVVGQGWPAVSRRLDMLAEAIPLIRDLLSGEIVDFDGRYFTVDAAQIWDLHEEPLEIGVSMTGQRSMERLALHADHFISTTPNAHLIEQWRTLRRTLTPATEGRVVGQIPISWDTDRDVAVSRAHDQFRWSGLDWSVNAELRTPGAFAAATAMVRPEDVAKSVPCGPDLDAIAEAVAEYRDAGFTDVALLQIGGDTQERFLREAAEPLLTELRTRFA